jgi:parallel beta-helix repeat protein
MRQILFNLLASVALIGGVMLLPAALATAATCTPTGWVRDSINMTAAQIGNNVSGSLDATGCNIGVYYGPLYDSGTTYPVTQGNVTGQAPSGNVSGATIFGANYFGVVVNGDVGAVSVNVTSSTIHDIGENPFDGTQHGVAIYYRAFGATANGTISGNTVTAYQKGGITVAGAVSATITNNTVTGLGQVNYIAQNGIQVAYGAKASLSGNTVTANQYTGAGNTSSAGILIIGGPAFSSPCGAPCAYTVGVTASKNTATNNDVGIWLFNAAVGYIAPSTATNNTIKFNTISDSVVSNTTGFSTSPVCGYQAGIADLGKKDLIVNNSISGAGYTPPQNPDCSGTPIPAFLRIIDVTTKARGTPSNK